MQHSKDFEHIKELYDNGIWGKKFVRGAVAKGKITADEYAEITGEPYAA